MTFSKTNQWDTWQNSATEHTRRYAKYVVFYCYAEFRFGKYLCSECHYAEWRIIYCYAECRYAKCRGVNNAGSKFFKAIINFCQNVLNQQKKTKNNDFNRRFCVEHQLLTSLANVVCECRRRKWFLKSTENAEKSKKDFFGKKDEIVSSPTHKIQGPVH